MPKEAQEIFDFSRTPSDSRHIYSVWQITQDIKLILENTFGNIWVEGEVTNFHAHPSGHFYFSLKDDKAVLSAAMFSYANKQVRFNIEDGQKVICFGKVNVYEPRGQYQLIVERIEPKGIGAQQLAFEQLKLKLAKQGLFDPAHKKELPLLPFCIGIVTSAAGAAVRDILQILKKGAAGINVVIRPVRVQGDGAGKEIALGIEELNQHNRADVIIISRGGGSTEDLWAFNEEVVARAIYGSRLPTISAVGHQINVTLADMVADCFVETPTAAAKIIVDKKNRLLVEIDEAQAEMKYSVAQIIGRLRQNLIALQHALKSPKDNLLERQQFLDELSLELSESIQRYLERSRERLRFMLEKLEALSPLAVLARGYSLSMLAENGEVIREAEALKKGDRVKTVLRKGCFLSKVEEVGDERQAEL